MLLEPGGFTKSVLRASALVKMYVWLLNGKNISSHSYVSSEKHETVFRKLNTNLTFETEFLKTPDSFAIPISGEHVMWGCLNG